jgi:hypothetical protein
MNLVRKFHQCTWRQTVGNLFLIAVSSWHLTAAATAAVPDWLQPITLTAEPFIGVTHYQIKQPAGWSSPILPRPLAIHLIEIDPKAPGISFLATPANGTAGFEYRRQTTSSFVNANDLAVRINGDFYPADSGTYANVDGLGMSSGVVVSPPAVNTHAFVTRTDGTATVASGAVVPLRAENAVAGNQRLLTNGVVTSPNDSYTTTLHPHSAVGVDVSNRHIFLMVVDGRQGNFSQGMRTDEMAEFLRAFGVDNAINLDGGGSSTLVFSDGFNGAARTVNSPSDSSTERSPGGERAVANQFGLYATPNPAYVPLASPPRPDDPASEPRLKTLTLLDLFEHTEGRFRSSPTGSDSNRGIDAAKAELSSETSQQGASSEKLTVVRDNSASGRLRFLSADGNPLGNRVCISGQLHAMGVTGYVGFFMKTLDAGLKVSLAVDDGYSSAVSGTEISLARDVIAGGQWHLYEWNLADPTAWFSFIGGNGTIDGPNSFIDSIVVDFDVRSSTKEISLFVDTVAYNPLGDLNSLAVPESTALPLLAVQVLIWRSSRRRP